MSVRVNICCKLSLQILLQGPIILANTFRNSIFCRKLPMHCNRLLVLVRTCYGTFYLLFLTQLLAPTQITKCIQLLHYRSDQRPQILSSQNTNSTPVTPVNALHSTSHPILASTTEVSKACYYFFFQIILDVLAPWSFSLSDVSSIDNVELVENELIPPHLKTTILDGPRVHRRVPVGILGDEPRPNLSNLHYFELILLS
jgi:hypothetical protein